GRIGFSADRGEIWFRKIEIKELPTKAIQDLPMPAPAMPQPNPMPTSKVGKLPPTVLPAEGFVPLFNGKDLTGWKTHPGAPGDWRVEDGILVGRGPKKCLLFTDRGDYVDFHFLVECK